VNIRDGADGGAPSGRWFQRHPKTTLGLVSLFLVILADLLAGLLLIPRDYNEFRRPHPYYHHGLRRNRVAVARWGPIEYPMYTNSLGLRDSQVRDVPLATARRRFLFVGDSFTAGVGVPYEETFVGRIEGRLRPAGIDVLNAAVVSYSPKLYYKKVHYLMERGLEFSDLVVFIDISDPHNEIAYEEFKPADFPIMARLRYAVREFLNSRSFLYYAVRVQLQRFGLIAVNELQGDGLFPCLCGIDPDLLADDQFRASEGIWTIDRVVYERYGKRGLELAATNMRRLVGLCRSRGIGVTIAVYPWPNQIFADDLESIQVSFWRDFAERNRIGFLNLFPDFINEEPPETQYGRYFILGDAHWNAAGHALVAERTLAYLERTASLGLRRAP
jgi:lysophospholipase L1-like esterase